MNAYGNVDGDPIVPDPGLVNATTNALVEVTTDDWKGTGFVTKDGYGKEVVVTAAHVVKTASMKQLTITTHDGRHVHPDGGCYIFDDSGKFQTLPTATSDPTTEEKKLSDTDVAVLTLPSDLTSTPLRIASTEAGSGSWVNFINYQADYGPNNSTFAGDSLSGDAAAYTGLVTPRAFSDADITVVTGAQAMGPKATEIDFETGHIQGGASGGPVENNKRQVVGVSVMGTEDGIYVGHDELKDIYHVSIDGIEFGAKTGFEPTVATIVPARVVRLALQSITLQPRTK